MLPKLVHVHALIGFFTFVLPRAQKWSLELEQLEGLEKLGEEEQDIVRAYFKPKDAEATEATVAEDLPEAGAAPKASKKSKKSEAEGEGGEAPKASKKSKKRKAEADGGPEGEGEIAATSPKKKKAKAA